MVSVNIIAVGQIKEPYYRDAVREYQKRLQGQITETVIPETKLSGTPSAAEIAQALEKEADAILKKIPKKSHVISMCIEGKQFDSVSFSQYIDRIKNTGISEFTFIVGSSYGLSDRVKSVSDLKLSMSGLTFPHVLARVMLYEMIYRTREILNNGRYHK